LGERALYKEYFKTNDLHYFPLPSLITGTTFPKVRQSLAAGTAAGTNVSFLMNGAPTFTIPIKKTNDGIYVAHHSILNYLGIKVPKKGPTSLEFSSTIKDDSVLQDYHSILLPKAVEYSTGILDYFFRGTLATTVVGITNGQILFNITNTANQDLTNGNFYLFYDDSSGTRTQLTGTDFSDSYSGALPAGGTTTGIFTPQTDATNYILIYQGTIGTTNGTNCDPVDAGIAIAATSFSVPSIVSSFTFNCGWADTLIQLSPGHID